MVRQVPMGRHRRAMLGQGQLTNSRNQNEEASGGLESQMHIFCNLAALASLSTKPYWLKYEIDEEPPGGGHDAQPLREFAMFETISSVAPRQAVLSGDARFGQAKRSASFGLCSCAAPAPTRGAVLAVRSVRGSLDAGAGAEPGDRVGGVAAGSDPRQRVHRGEQRIRIEPRARFPQRANRHWRDAAEAGIPCPWRCAGPRP
jgi:hypothetical protein